MIPKRSLWAMLAMLIGTTGAGCRESNPAYLSIDAGKDRPSPVSADLAGPKDKVGADNEPADRVLPDLGDRDAVMDASVSDLPPDQWVDWADASVEGTGGADSPRDAGDAAGDAAVVLSDTPPGPGDGGVVGLDTNPDQTVDRGLKLDVGSNFDAGLDLESSLNLDAGLSLDASLNLDEGLNLDAEEDLVVGGDAEETSASETGPDLE